jgi:hypothetical protein
MNTIKLAESLGLALGTIAAFERKTQRAEYTDTGEAWEILYAVRKHLRAAVRAADFAAKPKAERAES